MTALFADTFYWIALTDFRDSAHERAVTLTFQRTDVPIVTTDEVIVEFLTFFATAPEQMRRKALGNARRILDSPSVRVVPQSRASLLAGMTLYEARPDKEYSLTDCISMQTMRREGITEALTNDRHFEQEGFRALFRDTRGAWTAKGNVSNCLTRLLSPESCGFGTPRNLWNLLRDLHNRNQFSVHPDGPPIWQESSSGRQDRY